MKKLVLYLGNPLNITAFATLCSVIISSNLYWMINGSLEGVSKIVIIALVTTIPLAYILSNWMFIVFAYQTKHYNAITSQHDHLLKAKNKAEKKAKVKSDFLSTMSHEIRTPLNAVIGMTHMLLEDSPRKDQLEQLNILKFSADNLLVLINDILDYSKIEAGKMELVHMDFDLTQMMSNLVESMQPKAIENIVFLNLFIDSKVPQYLKGDKTRLAQVLNNLISNAIKFTNRGDVFVRVHWVAEEEETVCLRFEVEDTGIGIAADKLKTIFNSFEQAEKDTSNKFGGTGLGLAISKFLLELQGSELKVTSQLSKGARFFFDLEILKSKEVRNIIDQRVISPGRNRNELEGLNVLLVEDNKINQMVAIKFLEKWKVNYDLAENGEVAFKKVMRRDYDIVIMDLHMPILDGYEVTKRIRSRPENKYKSLPIIALTASAMAEEKANVFRVGMNDYVTKPFDPDELYCALFKYIPVI